MVNDTVSAKICTPSLYQTSASCVPEALQIKLKVVSLVKLLNTWFMVVLASITSGSEKGKEEMKMGSISLPYIASHEFVI